MVRTPNAIPQGGYVLKNASHYPAANGAAQVVIASIAGEWAKLKKIAWSLTHATAVANAVLTIEFESVVLKHAIGGQGTVAFGSIDFPDGIGPEADEESITVTVTGVSGNTAMLYVLYQ